MRVAIIHYHLRPGGVTRVIETSARVLAAAGTAVAIVVGEDPPPSAAVAGVPVRVVPGLGYASDAGPLTAVALAATLREAATAALGGPPDIWHFHNHALGKNVLLAEVVALLAEAGERLVLQLHDLVEDGRAQNHARIARCRTLYPAGPRIGYLFINSRDVARFCQLGLAESNAVLLPNAVAIAPGMPQPDHQKIAGSWVVYPVRGIRRKNLGEVVLLAALAPTGVRFAVTAAPVAIEWLGIHEAWRAFARERQLPVEFAVVGRLEPQTGAGTSLEAWLAHASQWLTTSVAEGFGFAFLDAIALDKPLIGRNLPHLAIDWAAAGLHCDGLYDRILVPVELAAPGVLETLLHDALTAAYRGYGREVSAAEVARALGALTADGWLDFGNLPETIQSATIDRLLADRHAVEVWLEIAGERMPAAAWLAERLGHGQDARTTASNTPVASLAPWSETIYQTRLLAAYMELLDKPAAEVGYLDSARLLDHCLTPETFHFLGGPPISYAF